MATNPPDAIDVSDIQFKLHNKTKLFEADPSNFPPCNLLASASAYGLIIIGCPTPELKVIQLASIVNGNPTNSIAPVRRISLPSPAVSIALSCDHSLLAVHFIQNGMPFINIFAVQSFMANNITAIYTNIVVTPESNVWSTELLWNPVITKTLAICTSNGSLIVLNFNDQGYEMHSIDKSEQVRCASWSPKGKQIVVGFPNGKLAQYKPDLQLARTIPCPDNVFAGPFDVISLQWLSTYQFAAVFLKQEQGSFPAFIIVNAAKNVPPTYINYDDICYSQSGPRKTQVYLCHLLPWNLILVGSANSMEIGVMGTKETGETPTWIQYTMLDEARAECPLTPDRQETYPIGLVIETGSMHQLTINEVQLPIMPMLHMLSSYGLLISFDIINTIPNIQSVCSPPIPLPDSSGIAQFKSETPPAYEPPKSNHNEVSFSLPANAATSTPTVQKTSMPSEHTSKAAANLFGNATNEIFKPAAGGSLFGGQTTLSSVPTSAFSAVPKTSEAGVAASAVPPAFPSSTFGGGTLSFSSFGASGNSAAPTFGTAAPLFNSNATATFGQNAVTTAAVGSTGIFGGLSQSQTSIQSAQISKQFGTALKTISQEIPQQSVEQAKPFLTVTPTYTMPADAETKQRQPESQDQQPLVRSGDPNHSDNVIIRKIIAEEIQSFESVWKNALLRSKTLNIKIGTKDEIATTSKQLTELKDITDQATESTDALTAEIQSLRISLNEAFSMAAEAKSRYDLFKSMECDHLRDTSAMSQTNRRQLDRLQKTLAINENQVHIVSRQIDANWSAHQDTVKVNAKAKMHVPQLENVYMTLSKQRTIINVQKQKIAQIKSKVGYRDLSKAPQKSDHIVNSLTDSIFSMSLCDQVKSETERLSSEKVASLRELLNNRTEISIIKPKRPTRKGLNSEVVIEKRMQQAKKIIPPATPVVQMTSKNETAPRRETEIPNQYPSSDGSAFNIGISAAAFSLTTKTVPQISQKQFQQQPKQQQPLPIQAIKPKAAISSSASVFSVSQTLTSAPAFIVPTVAASAKPSTQSIFGATKGTFGDQSTESVSPFSFSNTPIAFGINSQNKSTKFGVNASVAAPSTTDNTTAFSGTIDSLTFGPPKSTPFNVGSSVPSTTVSPFQTPAAPIFNISSATTSLAGTTTTKSSNAPAILKKPFETKSANSNSLPPTPPSPQQQTTAFSVFDKLKASSDKENQPTKGAFSFGDTFAENAIPLSEKPATASGFGSFTSKPLNSTSNSPVNIFGNNQGASVVVPTVIATTSIAPTTIFMGNNLSITSTTATTPTSLLMENLNASVPATSIFTGTTATSSLTSTQSNVTPTTVNTTINTTTSKANEFTFSLGPADTQGLSVTAPAAPTTPLNLATIPTSVASSVANEQAVPSIDNTDQIFQGLTVCKPTVIPSSASVNSAQGNIFTMTSFDAPLKSTESNSIFGNGSITTATSAFGGFGTNTSQTSVQSSTTSPFAALTPGTQSASPFAAFVAANPVSTSASIFSGFPKPDQSAFGNSNTTTTTTSNIFGGDNKLSGSNIFGTPSAVAISSATPSFGSGSIFGGAASAQSPFDGNPIFGGQPSAFGVQPTASPIVSPSANIFQQTAAATVVSPTSGSSMFGGTSSFGNNNTTAAAIASPSSIFSSGNALAPSAFGSNAFGSGGFASPQTAGGSSIFGGQAVTNSASSPFGGSFMQSGPSIAQTGFGAPAAAGSPTGSAAPGLFGGPPAFGAPSFGGAPTFGSPKGGFGSFAQAASPNAFATQVTQKNSLFETLGSSETGMTFGNIAQSSNNAAQNPSFSGGSSFSSWR